MDKCNFTNSSECFLPALLKINASSVGSARNAQVWGCGFCTHIMQYLQYRIYSVALSKTHILQTIASSHLYFLS